MNRQAIVGIFTIVALFGLFGVFLVLANIGTQGRYKIGVHFKSAGGLHRGALVSASGVVVGLVDGTALLPDDYTVEVILAIDNGVKIARGSRFIVIQPVTGDVSLDIVPPSAMARAENPSTLDPLPTEVLPLAQQPQGTNPPSLTDLLEEGQGQVQRLDRMLAQLEKSEPALLATLQATLSNANELTVNSSRQLTGITTEISRLIETLNTGATASSRNLVDLTGELDGAVSRNSRRFDAMVTSLSRTARSLNQTVDSVRDLAADRGLRKNLLDTTKGLAQTAETIGAITVDLRQITGNPQTQAQLRDTVANVDAATQKLNTILGTLGGRSNVYGVDRAASPAPVASGAPLPSPAPAGGPGAVPDVRRRLGQAARGLATLQIRLTELDRLKPGLNSSPILTDDRGPQTDLNLLLLPAAATSLLVGANDLSSPHGTGTWNALFERSMAPEMRVGFGLLYSRLGVTGSFDPKRSPVGGELRLYDPRRPTLDGFVNYKLTPGLLLFGGERDATRAARRASFGLQLQL